MSRRSEVVRTEAGTVATQPRTLSATQGAPSAWCETFDNVTWGDNPQALRTVDTAMAEGDGFLAMAEMAFYNNTDEPRQFTVTYTWGGDGVRYNYGGVVFREVLEPFEVFTRRTRCLLNSTSTVSAYLNLSGAFEPITSLVVSVISVSLMTRACCYYEYVQEN